ncbi:hypothetical protein EW145_g3245 [Phellinidium pouzarii]|uniref:GH16 domain-containing protein n=1 Tax=Phellinidium pouzarii TaxID=167371 RepID=A0A4S4L9B2_9AGAM|nr:hypothetical protein EW145_g3245 [Phellinidium pouzarii]
MFCCSALLGLTTLTLSSTAEAANLTLSTEYSGRSFFSAWTFYSGPDTNTTGNVLYQSFEQATSSKLAFVNDAGNAIIKVDNTTSGVGDPNFGRPSVKMYSNATVSQGSLVVMDALHVPYGCSVWPAFWMQGSNWPVDGEIDMFENVNQATNNRYTLHTTDGCTHPDNSSSSSIETGTVISTDCFNATADNQGCSVQDPSTSSYGAGFASNGGGVYAMLWDDDISVWFFSRSSIPTDIASPNPDNWGTPTAFWPKSSCDASKFFKDQTLIFDITLCGNFAGEAAVFAQTCSGTCTDLVQTPSNYDTAYFEVQYVRVFTGEPLSSAARASGITSTTVLSIGVAALVSVFGSFLTAYF